jgi:hypothetical protein
VVFRALITLTRRDIRVFETRAQAIASLLSRRAASGLLPTD